MPEMSTNPWEPWLSELEGAVDASDGVGLREGLDNLQRFAFHEQRGRQPERWDRLFALLLRLLGHGDEVRDLAYHYVFVVMWLEWGLASDQDAREDGARQLARRTVELLPVLAPLVRSGALSLLRCTDNLVHAEGLVDLGPQEIYERWIASFGDDVPLALAARIAYLDGRGPWVSGEEALPALLDDADPMVRAYAARELGRRYMLSEDELTPPLRDVTAMLTAKEIERPGIAGPFFSNWYADGAVLEFEREAGVKVEEWFCTILGKRKQAEPNTLPCSNGIDFFAHEVFGDQPDYVRRVLAMGHVELAIEAATEEDERVDGMEPVLVELGESANAAVCQRAARQLADHYRVLHVAGERRGFVTRRTLVEAGAEMFINLSPQPGGETYAYAAVLYPLLGETFCEAAAAACLEIVLPQAMRGALLPFGMPDDGDEPGFYVRGRRASARYQCGALVERRGDVAAGSWARVRILWCGTPGAWSPETLA